MNEWNYTFFPANLLCSGDRGKNSHYNCECFCEAGEGARRKERAVSGWVMEIVGELFEDARTGQLEIARTLPKSLSEDNFWSNFHVTLFHPDFNFPVANIKKLHNTKNPPTMKQLESIYNSTISHVAVSSCTIASSPTMKSICLSLKKEFSFTFFLFVSDACTFSLWNLISLYRLE